MLTWSPECGDVRAWMHELEQLVFGSAAAGYVYSEVEYMYHHEKIHERTLGGANEAAYLLRRFAEGDQLLAVIGLNSLDFVPDRGNGEHGGPCGITAIAPENARGTLDLRRRVTGPADVVEWLDEITTTLFDRPYLPATAEPPSGRFDVPVDYSLRNFARGNGAFTGVHGSREVLFVFHVDDIEFATRPMLLPQMFQEPVIATTGQLCDWLAPAITQLLLCEPNLCVPSAPMPQPLTARIDGAHSGSVCVEVGHVRTRWLRDAQDVAPLLNPAIYQRCRPAKPQHLATWMSDMANVVFGEATPWTTNWDGQSQPIGISGDATEVAKRIFAERKPLSASVASVDVGFLKVLIEQRGGRTTKLVACPRGRSPKVRWSGR